MLVSITIVTLVLFTLVVLGMDWQHNLHNAFAMHKGAVMNSPNSKNAQLQ